MSEKESTRRKFLKFLGLSAGATLVSSKMLAGIVKPEDIRTLNPHQQEFMVDYGKWMDELRHWAKGNTITASRAIQLSLQCRSQIDTGRLSYRANGIRSQHRSQPFQFNETSARQTNLEVYVRKSFCTQSHSISANSCWSDSNKYSSGA